MNEIKGFIGSIKEIEYQHWKTASWALLYTLIFGLLPTWAAILMHAIFSVDLKFESLAGNGQFAIYSAALIATGLYFIAREFNVSKFSGRPIFLILLCVLLIVASLIVGSVTVSSAINLPIDKTFIMISSVLIFAFTVPIYFITAAKNESGIAEEYKNVHDKELEELMKKFPGSGGEEGGR